MRILLFLFLFLFLVPARVLAGEPVCTAASAAKARQLMLKPYSTGNYEDAYNQLEAFRAACSSKLDARTLGWVHSDLALAAGRAHMEAKCWELVWEAEGFSFNDEKLRSALRTNRFFACTPEEGKGGAGAHTLVSADCPRLAATFQAQLVASPLTADQRTAESAAFTAWCAASVGSVVSQFEIDCAAGNTRDSNYFNKEPYRLAHHCLKVPDVPAAPSSEKKSEGIPGTETPQTLKVAGYSQALSFAKYIVLSKSSGEGNGDVISVYKNTTGAQAAVTAGSAKPYVEIRLESTFFKALAGDILLLDQGTGGPGQLAVYDLTKKAVVFETLYSGVTEVAEGRRVSYFTTTKRVPNATLCPQMAEWIGQGLTVEVAERTVVDLATKKETPTGELRCEGAQ